MFCLFQTLPAVGEEQLAVAAAGFILPDGALAAVREGGLFGEGLASSSPASSGAASEASPESSGVSSSASSSGLPEQADSSAVPEDEDAVAAGLFPENGPVETVLENGINETTISNTGIQYGNCLLYTSPPSISHRAVTGSNSRDNAPTLPRPFSSSQRREKRQWQQPSERRLRRVQ